MTVFYQMMVVVPFESEPNEDVVHNKKLIIQDIILVHDFEVGIFRHPITKDAELITVTVGGEVVPIKKYIERYGGELWLFFYDLNEFFWVRRLRADQIEEITTGDYKGYIRFKLPAEQFAMMRITQM